MAKKALTPTAKRLQEVLMRTIQNELEEYPEKYAEDAELLKNIDVSMYVKERGLELHKGGRTKFMKVYEKETKLLFENKIVDFKEFGFLTFVGTLFTSYEDNVLKNKDGTPCTQKDIIKASGMTRSTISALLNKLEEKRLIFVTENAEVTNGKMYCLNPMVFYKGALMTAKRKETFKQIEEDILAEWSNKDGNHKNNNQKINEAIHAIVEVEDSLTDEI